MRRTLLLSCLLPVAGTLLVVPVADAAPRETCHGKVATIVGDDRDNRITGTPAADVIVGGRGADRIDGRGGDDVICGGRGTDVLLGGRGRDRLLGGLDGTTPGKYGSITNGDELYPGPGNDVVDAGWDPRQRRNGQTSDTIHAGPRVSGIVARLRGPGGWGTIAGEGRDRIRGQRSLTVHGTGGDDVLIGGAGSDTFDGNGGSDEIRGGPGDDFVVDHDDLRRGVDADLLQGGAGDDFLSSSGGPDTVQGAGGDDDLHAYAGSCAVLSGGGGNDDAGLGGLGSDLTYDAATGQSFVMRSAPCGTTEAEHLILGSVGGDVTYAGTDGPDEVRVFSGTGVAMLDLRGGDDTAWTDSGDDAIFGGAGTDTVDAGDGYDACVDVEAGTSCESPAFPAVRTCDGLPATIVADPTRAGEALVGTDGDDVIFGSDGDDTINAGGGNDVICGRGGSDTISGGDGNDRLFGQDDRRFVYEDGQAGYYGDTLLPGPGDDHVDGGLDSRRTDAGATGPDRISWEDAGAGIIADFASSPASVTGATSGTDTIVLAGALSVTGTRFDDVINGTQRDDSIDAAGGTDTVDGRGGYDSCWRAERRTNCERH